MVFDRQPQYNKKVRSWRRALSVLLPMVAAVCLAEPASRSVRDGVYTEDQAKRGRELYAGQCYQCHGRDLEGAYESHALAGDDFISDWDGQTLAPLFDRIFVTMSGDAPGNMSGGAPPKPLTRAQTADLVAFLLYFNKYPAGNTALSTKPEVLAQIRFEAPKP